MPTMKQTIEHAAAEAARQRLIMGAAGALAVLIVGVVLGLIL
jgi:hypothetical protein